MQIVINIEEKIYNLVKSWNYPTDTAHRMLFELVTNGTPLPKGHGDLIDVNRKITVSTYDEQYEEWGAETLTVLEVLNSWSDEGVTEKDIIIQADKAETKQVGNPDRLEGGDK